ncbi:MAG: DUF167 family protein [Hyphomicrobium sp.]|jgi:uncharacterized protein (TIGR00251 family)|nr:DUF167 family protein [Hyphomicrobium sp.]
MPQQERPWQVAEGCVIVRVRVAPKSSKDTIDGVEPTAGGPGFKVRVRAVPAEGEANEAVTRLLADWLDIPKSRVTVASGHRSRVKSIKVTGDAASLDSLLAARLLQLS